jgi:hypothetical protein
MYEKKRHLFFFILAFLSFIIIICLCFNIETFCGKWSIRYAKKKGDDIVKRIENYKMLSGRLPESFCEIGLKPDEYWKGQATNFHGTKYFYEKLSDREYEIYFSLSVGDALYFNSSRAEWSLDP